MEVDALKDAVLASMFPSAATSALISLHFGWWAHKLCYDTERRIRYLLVLGIAIAYLGVFAERSYWFWLWINMDRPPSLDFAFHDLISLLVVRVAITLGGCICLQAFWRSLGFNYFFHIWGGLCIVIWFIAFQVLQLN